ncbi:TetR family transcriptional regulator [Mycobacteroides saopaulense]|uniref:TetR family transcriptional regulator n=1 Tax=Mycobacteroides saopaulense TaxID=1578165 RepID=A0A1S1JF80_9MYCO|nr:TetR family transcriptional regulator [Mycobacteroides saopaulense]ALR10918.1 transcriptional regulator [Mycobacteroides saopaulense]OHT82399.1 TetR family transcriptional regulator [Mycobacteroides saopaulense]OHU01783.1 TetR family transcriptional regulator [Mycobacteroides saopaulense]ORB58883.1 TetR family transcriptional regulator [Mycobacteroides saopaulense]
MTSLSFRRARSEENKRQRAATIVEAARAMALESGVASVTLTGLANRAGVHHSAVRRYFSSHKEVLLRLSMEGMAALAKSVCTALDGPQDRSPADVGAVLSGALIAAPLFCDLLGSHYLHLEHEVEIDHAREAQRVNQEAAMTIVEAIERAAPALDRKGALDIVTSAFALAGLLWQFAHPPEGLEHDYGDEPGIPDDWDTDFASTLTRLLTATCIGAAKKP